MNKPIYSSEDEGRLMGEVWSKRIADNPEAFVMMMYPWGVKGTPLESKKGPRAWQSKILRMIRDHIRDNKDKPIDLMEMLKAAVASGRGIGKSALVAWLVHWMQSTRIGSTVIISANSEAQLRTTTFGELTRWVTMSLNCHWFEIVGIKMTAAQWLRDLVERDLKKGTRYWFAEGKLWSEEKPDSFVGAHNHDGMMVVFDEASGIADVIWDVTMGFFTEEILDRYWFAFSNPRRNEGAFFECFEDEYWRTEQIDARTVEGVDKKLYEEIIAKNGEDSYEARVEVYGQFPSQDDTQFFSVGDVDRARERPWWYEDDNEPIYMGIDPAGEGKDKTGIIIVQGRNMFDPVEIKEGDPEVLTRLIIERIQEHHPDLSTIDAIGIGWGIQGSLKMMGYKTKPFKGSHRSSKPNQFLNMRAEGYFNFRDWMKDASIPKHDGLRKELLGIRRKISRNGVVAIESKEEMAKRGVSSPNLADAASMTMVFKIFKKREVLTNEPRRRSPVFVGGANSWMAA